MQFSENLQTLRKREGLTQEQLAERLEVSRQAVSKWESGQATPDVEKLAQLCDLFHATMDQLVRGDFADADAGVIKAYDRHMTSYARRMALSIALMILGVAALLLIEGLGVKPEGMGMVGLFAFLLAGVPIAIVEEIRHEQFLKDHPAIEPFYSPEEIARFRRKFPARIALGVAGILLGVVLVVLAGILRPEDDGAAMLAMTCLMTLIALSVGILVHAGLEQDKYDVEAYNRKNDPHSKEARQDARVGKACGAIMLLATAAFLLTGFLWKRWDICWVSFAVGGVLCGLAAVVLKSGDKN